MTADEHSTQGGGLPASLEHALGNGRRPLVYMDFVRQLPRDSEAHDRDLVALFRGLKKPLGRPKRWMALWLGEWLDTHTGTRYASEAAMWEARKSKPKRGRRI
jgi:hypothetical protein